MADWVSSPTDRLLALQFEKPEIGRLTGSEKAI
jgi:hypothetical protein